MADRDDMDLMAAEYVLGTLDARDHARAQGLVANDASFSNLVAAWERRLGPLSEAVPDMQPPQHLRSRIEAAIGGSAQVRNGVREAISNVAEALERRLAVWRLGALASGAAAALALALWFGGIEVPGRPQAPVQDRYVAMLMGDAGNYGFVITVEPKAEKLMVRCLVPDPPDNHDYELWLLKDGAEPKTLGIVPPGQFMYMPMPDRMDMPEPDKRIKLAVSLEPRGGARGQQMGKVMYAGDLMKLTP
ncbi:MAG: anti-sigma factor [Pseudomonadota bacterium]|nr:anti-sigma factor [Pseudomonadota bacterium]